ncbi:hypothetical protein E308F_16250 [Moorella sp. E308F]|uniref:DUF3883 domain-containing protein n=1 Tax=unclassified Neomoorella TaxID=2676739 RepID=UPI0010FFC5C7|nr:MULTISPECIES: DUF3883 domain-containing protein [unclassified Moorella (in: firmicutes)]GEA15381.1 hypothetical protein E308F_16250 [Moorella sp. E308F]GEA19758.1 hypothetical protein E306M_28970 [Moorella sp. E306M]
MDKLVEHIQEQFIKEARNSPLLLIDLANMETYMAESYKARSFIELLQNADDAKARRFIVMEAQDILIIGNDGRYFTEEDVWAICRSGASGKRRGGDTIGYRGIGFKSVVNLARRVHVLSGELKMTFCRELSQRALGLNINVPLIRIPHHYNPYNKSSQLEGNLEELWEEGYITLFIFEGINTQALNIELENFDPTSLLFLKNIKQVEFKTELSKLISIKRKRDNDIEIAELSTDEGKQRWVIVRNSHPVEAVAFQLGPENTLIKATPETSVAHAFTPTKEPVGIACKVNGDFSTDPSRTKIDCDEFTRKACQNCTDILVNLLKNVLSKKLQHDFWRTLFEVIEIHFDPLERYLKRSEFRNLFLTTLIEKLKATSWIPTSDGLYCKPTQIKTKPDWLNLDDYEGLVSASPFYPVNKVWETGLPGITGFITNCGATELDMSEVLTLCVSYTLSSEGAAQVIAECIKRYRFGIPSEIKNLLSHAKLFECDDGQLHSVNELQKNKKEIAEKWINMVQNLIPSTGDLIWFLNQIGLSKYSTITFKNKAQDNIIPTAEICHSPNSIQLSSDQTPLKKSWTQYLEQISNKGPIPETESVITKWRSAELNLAALFNSIDGIEAIDVSKSNIGYDLEVRNPDGTVEYIEVKCVEEIGLPFSLTNNEYSMASKYGENYILALVKPYEKSFAVCFIKDPVNQLNFERRCMRWEWVCDKYPISIKQFPYGE